MKQMFVRYISHEIRTPLNTVSIGIELVMEQLRDGSRPEDVLNLLEDVKVSGETAGGILNSLLDYDKIESGIFQVEVERVYVLKIVLEAIRAASVQVKISSRYLFHTI